MTTNLSELVSRLKDVGAMSEDQTAARCAYDAATEIDALSKRCADLEAALKMSFRAINDWVAVYASDMCDDESVEETKRRIRGAGGTLAYVAEINAALGPLIQEQKKDG